MRPRNGRKSVESLEPESPPQPLRQRFVRMVREVATLTPPQQRVIIFIFLALLLFTLVKQYRQTRYPLPTVETQPSPSPGILP